MKDKDSCIWYELHFVVAIDRALTRITGQCRSVDVKFGRTVKHNSSRDSRRADAYAAKIVQAELATHQGRTVKDMRFTSRERGKVRFFHQEEEAVMLRILGKLNAQPS